MKIFVQDQASGPEGLRPGGVCEKNNCRHMWLIFRGLFFEHNVEVGQKDLLWTGTC